MPARPTPDAEAERRRLGGNFSDGLVNSADINQTKSQIGLAVGPGNFREDVIADNSINGKDLSLVKSQSGTALP